MRRTPRRTRVLGTCRYCGEEHWPFKPCAARDEAKAEAEASKPPPVPLQVTYLDDPGWRPFGDRLLNYENRGGNLHLLPKRKVSDGE